MNIKKRIGILDIEGNALFPEVTKIWCLVFRDIETDEVFTWRPHQIKNFQKWLFDNAEKVIGHNLIGYDVPTIEKVLGFKIPLHMIVDTLVLSRLHNPTLLGGHSLGAWGKRLGEHKGEWNDFSKYSEEQLLYCIQDTNVNAKLYKHLIKELENFSEFSIRLEHKSAYLLFIQEENGFNLDIEKATELQKTTSELVKEYDRKLRQAFPPIFKLISTYTPKKLKFIDEYTKTSLRIRDKYLSSNDKKLEITEDGLWNLYELEEFNPGSGMQVADRLLDKGWKPSKFTPTGRPATDKETLTDAIETLAHIPEVKMLAEYGIITDRLQKVVKWLELSQVRGDNKVHGRVNPLGAGTHRCSHYDDNMANIASVIKTSIKRPLFITKYGEPSLYKTFEDVDEELVFIKDKGDKIDLVQKGLKGGFGWESRSCWIADSPDTCVIGADASGIQLRALAHYMEDDTYTHNLLQGDIHIVNQQAAGIETRDTAKTFIYAWLLGAGDYKIGTIVGVKDEEVESLLEWGMTRLTQWGKPLLDSYIYRIRREGQKATKKLVATYIKGFKVKEQFLERTPALKRLKTVDIPLVAKKGFLEGLDGRRFIIPSEHLAMSLYLQGFEAVIMKLAMCLYSDSLKDRGVYFKQAAMVHDEYQIIGYRKDADLIGQTVVTSIRKAGEILKSRCPLDGEYKIGNSWAQTH